MSPMFWGETIEVRHYFKSKRLSWHAYQKLFKKRRIERKLSHVLLKTEDAPEFRNFALDHQKYIWRLWQYRQTFKYYGFRKSKPLSFFRFWYTYEHNRKSRTLYTRMKYRNKELLKLDRRWFFSHGFNDSEQERTIQRAWKWRLNTRVHNKFTQFDPQFIKKFVYSRRRYVWAKEPANEILKVLELQGSPLGRFRDRVLKWVTGISFSEKDIYIDRAIKRKEQGRRGQDMPTEIQTHYDPSLEHKEKTDVNINIRRPRKYKDF
jgi:hypothetical protein